MDINGTPGNDLILGTPDPDRIDGEAGDDVLLGLGGDDVLIGDTGNDTFHVEDFGDIVIEAAGEGLDRIAAYVSYVLGGGVEVETLEAITQTDTSPIDLTGNEFANSVIGNAGSNHLSGGAGDDHLIGLAGDDILIGGSGLDFMHGGLGDDIYFVDAAGDSLQESAGEGVDRVAAAASYALAGDVEIETLETVDLAGTAAIDLFGNGFDNRIIGNAAANRLDGNGGSDLLVGAAGNDLLLGGSGADRMFGGTGNDIYFVDHAADEVTESAGEGIDRLASSVSYRLASGAEVETIETIDHMAATSLDLTGSDTANAIYGNLGANVLDGGAGADTLNGLGGNDILIGGTGSDAMTGGSGDDVYFVDNSGDSVREALGEGTDRVVASVSFYLGTTVAPGPPGPPGQEIEILETIDVTATDLINLGGSNTDNIIYGNAGPNGLDGYGGQDRIYGFEGNDSLFGGEGDDVLVGGPGADDMHGWRGNDIMYVDHPGDFVRDSGGGIDRVAASVSYVLPTDADGIEFLEAITPSATDPIDLTGDDNPQRIQGNDGSNILDGRAGADQLYGLGGDDILIGGDNNDVLVGGPGNDEMIGGSGADTYVVEDIGDIVSEQTGSAGDRVTTSVSYALDPGAEIEIFEVANQSGTADIDLTGNQFANALYGSNGVNTLTGGGGDDVLLGRGGNDLLIGGGGEDAFAFAGPLDNVDRIDDFVTGSDNIYLSAGTFQSFSSGALPGGSFVTGTQAQDADDRIIYDPGTGNLFYDPDGSGAESAVQFAVLTGAPALVASDFVVI